MGRADIQGWSGLDYEDQSDPHLLYVIGGAQHCLVEYVIGTRARMRPLSYL
jgi:hypothetical protein